MDPHTNMLDTFDEVIFTDEVEQYQALCTSLGWVYTLKDIHSKYQTCNQAATTLYGYQNDEEVLGISDADIRAPAAECTEQFIYQDNLVITSGELYNSIDIHPYADDRTHCHQALKLPVIDHNAKSVGVLCIGIPLQNVNKILKHLATIAPTGRYFSFAGNFSYLIKARFSEFFLSETESMIIFHLLRQATLNEIAHYFNSSPKQIERHIHLIQHKLACSTTTELIEKSVEHQLQMVIPTGMLSQQNYGLLLPNSARA